MFVPKGYSWKAARSRLAPPRALWHVVRNTRVLLALGLVSMLVVLWRSMGSAAGEMQRFYCWGPSKPPMLMTANEHADWLGHLTTPVIFNHHKPVDINESSIRHVDLNKVTSTKKADVNRERVLILTPLRDATPYLEQHFDHISQLTYPHDLIDLAFLVGDSTDDTMAALAMELERVQSNPENAFHSVLIVQKDFGVTSSQNVEDRHSYKNQAPRRKAMARARNYLLSTALTEDHSWVYWRDVDVKDSPSKIIEDFVAHDKDVLVPSAYAFSGVDMADGCRHLVPPLQGAGREDGRH